MSLADTALSRGACHIPDYEVWGLSQRELVIVESIVSQIPRFSFEVAQYFISHNGAPALFFKEFSPEVVTGKRALEKALTRIFHESMRRSVR